MRVLHLPVNNGSRTSHTVRALRQKGVDARGLVRTRSYGQAPKGLKIIDLGSQRGKKYSLRLLFFILPWLYNFIHYLRWAEVVHWYHGALALPFGLDLALVKRFRKPGIIEWQGADIRIPEVEFAENPYYTAIYNDGYEYRDYETRQKSRRLQQQFARAGFACAAPPGMLQYVQRDIFPDVYILPRRLILSDYQPAFPKSDQTRPLVVHSPTAPVTKGTAAVLQVIERLKATCDFEFRLIQGVERHQAMQLMTQADILLDQFVLGDFGSSALEAMALGKVVVCYLKPSLTTQYPPELPIVNASQETLPTRLTELLKNARLRHNLGQQGRAYIEKHHNAALVADKLITIYNDILQKRRVGRG